LPQAAQPKPKARGPKSKGGLCAISEAAEWAERSTLLVDENEADEELEAVWAEAGLADAPSERAGERGASSAAAAALATAQAARQGGLQPIGPMALRRGRGARDEEVAAGAKAASPASDDDSETSEEEIETLVVSMPPRQEVGPADVVEIDVEGFEERLRMIARGFCKLEAEHGAEHSARQRRQGPLDSELPHPSAQGCFRGGREKQPQRGGACAQICKQFTLARSASLWRRHTGSKLVRGQCAI
ncbi:unnamed protein product, partial [Effrenium voratum]